MEDNNETEVTETTQPVTTESDAKATISDTVVNLDDAELMKVILNLLETGRIGIRSDFMQNDPDKEGNDLIVASVLSIRIGQKSLTSEPNPFEWPLQLATMSDTGIEVIPN